MRHIHYDDEYLIRNVNGIALVWYEIDVTFLFYNCFKKSLFKNSLYFINFNIIEAIL